MVKSTNSPLVIVAIASYNNERYIEETLDSINAQTYNNIELLIIDDCSTDNSVQVIETWLKKCRYPYKFIKHKENWGITKTCNDLLRHANPDAVYYSILGSDDTIFPEKIETQVNILEKSNESVGMVYTDAYVIDENGKRHAGTYMTTKVIGRFKEPPQGDILEYLDKQFFLTQSLLYKKRVFDIVGNYDESLVFEDWDMTLRIVEQFEVLYCSEILVNYRMHSNSYMGKVKNFNVLVFPFYIKHIKKEVFRKKAAAAVTDIYLSDKVIAGKFLSLYNDTTSKKHVYSWYIKNDYPPLLLKLVNMKSILKIIKRRINNIFITGKSK